MSNAKKLKQSETVVIKRSQINFAPYNPKRHTKELILKQLRNFKNIGLLGGIVWNEKTGNLVSGHKRTMALDIYYKYDGKNDYDIKVEKVSLTEKQEKEQNIFMDAKSSNTSQDYELLANLMPDIDYKLAGLDIDEMNLIAIENPSMDIVEPKKINENFKSLENRKETIKKEKARIKKEIGFKAEQNYITLSFDNYENKAMFMETFGFNGDMTIIKGESFFDLINYESQEKKSR
jgi:hypothetical protein